MIERLQRELARNRAEKVVSEMGFISLPINPRAIATKLKIECRAQPLDGFSGCLVKAGDNFGILYASRFSNEGVINFTIAHELGHFHLDGHPEKLFPGGKGMHRSGLEFVSDDPLEKEADNFAVGLLMPEILFRAEIAKANDNGFDAILILSKACGTSLTATAIRFSEFTDNPLAVIVSTGRSIDYCFMSTALREGARFNWIRKGDLIPKNSGTFAFNKETAKVASGKTEEALSWLDQWFIGAPSIQFCEDIVGLGDYGKTLTILYSLEPISNPESQDSDL